MIKALPFTARAMHSLLAFAIFVVISSAAATFLLTIPYQYLAPSSGQIIDLSKLIFHIYIFSTLFFGLILFLPMTHNTVERQLRRGKADIQNGVLTGFCPSFILWLGSSMMGFVDLIYLALGTTLLIVNSIAGAIGGYAYWLTAGRPEHNLNH